MKSFLITKTCHIASLSRGLQAKLSRIRNYIVSCSPPSTNRTCPVTYGDSRRNRTTCATSCGSPKRPSGIVFPYSSSFRPAVMSVRMSPARGNRDKEGFNIQTQIHCSACFITTYSLCTNKLHMDISSGNDTIQ